MTYTEEQIENIVQLFRAHLHATKRCFYCGRKTRRIKPPQSRRRNEIAHPSDMRTSEHVIPKCDGGFLTVICCSGCNFNKGSMSLEEFRDLRYNGKQVEFFFETELRVRGLV